MTFLTYLFQRPLVEELGPSARRIARHRYQHDLSIALVSAGSFHLAVLLTALLLGALLENRPPPTPPPIHGSYEFETPPSIRKLPAETLFNPPPTPPRPPTPEHGILVPIPDDAPPDTMAAVPSPADWDVEGTNLNGGVGAGGPGRGSGNGDGLGLGPGDGDWGDYPPPDTLIVVEIEPVMVVKPVPDYPELAKIARIEGRVVVRALVGRDGKVKDAILIQGANSMLEEAALLAVRSAVFKPAIQQGHPVAVWVTIPFRFSLR